MSENEPGAPLTPKSIKSNITSDSDRDSLGPTKSFNVEGNSDGQRRHGDCMSIISDISTLSGYSTLSHPSHHNVRRRHRPMVRKGRNDEWNGGRKEGERALLIASGMMGLAIGGHAEVHAPLCLNQLDSKHIAKNRFCFHEVILAR